MQSQDRQRKSKTGNRRWLEVHEIVLTSRDAICATAYSQSPQQSTWPGCESYISPMKENRTQNSHSIECLWQGDGTSPTYQGNVRSLSRKTTMFDRSRIAMRYTLFVAASARGRVLVLPPLPKMPDQHWITTWSTANAEVPNPEAFKNQTIREIVHTTIGRSRRSHSSRQQFQCAAGHL